LDFTFSDIPVLGQDPKDKGEGFSFESFKPAAAPPKQSTEAAEHLDSFTQMLADSESENDEDERYEGEDIETTQELSAEFLDTQKAKWQKITKSKNKKSKVPIIAVICGVALMVIAGGAYFLLPGDSDNGGNDEPSVKKTPVKKPPVKKEPVKKEPVKAPANEDESGKPPDETDPDKPKPGDTETKAPVTKDDDIKIVKPGDDKAGDPKTDPKPEIKPEATGDTGETPKTGESLEYDAKNPDAVVKKKEIIKPLAEYYNEIFELVAEEKTDDATELTFEMFEKHPGKYNEYLDFQNKLIQKKYNSFAVNIFQTVYKSKSHSPEAAFLYGKSLGSLPLAETYLTKAVFIQKDYLDAYIVLGSYYYQKREWDKAIDTYNKGLKHYPSKSQFRERVVVCNIWKGAAEGEKAILEYENHLSSKGFSEDAVGSNMINLAQMMPNPDLAKKYLGMMRTGLNKSKIRKEYAIALLKQKAVYSKVTIADFKKLSVNDVREEYIACLLYNGQERKVMTLTTPPKYFPDFWKAFLSWKYESRLWEKSAQLLNDRHRDSEDKMIYLITSLWLKKISAEDARARVNQVGIESEPLYYMLIAEYYKKEKKRTKARVVFNKALKNKYGIYYNLIKHYRSK